MRVRRGNAEDHALLRRRVLDAAFALHGEGGIEALSMRAIAARIGVSAMALYRYFASKAELVHAMWGLILAEALERVQTAVETMEAPRERLRASIEAGIDYWESHPERFRLVFMSPELVEQPDQLSFTEAPEYRDLVTFSQGLITDFIVDVGGHPRAAPLARDLRLSMIVGYLHSKVFNRRHPWTDHGALRAYTVEATMQAIESCALSCAGALPRPEAGSAQAQRRPLS